MEAEEMFHLLESNQPKIVEEIKSKFHELFNNTKDNWLLNGIFDYYLATNSTRAIEVLLGVREPHDKFLFDRISDSIRGHSKLQALTLLGHVVRKQPAWLYKITQHNLFRDMIKLLKVETDILPMMSALLVLIVLLPMVPGYMGPYLLDIFEVFCRVASWNTLNPAKLSEEHLVHLQVGLYALFIRLYGMFPCNFLAFLRHQYGLQENLSIFTHTIKPMLDSVRMHPLLVSASKETETIQDRWKNKVHHDVLVECARFALERMQGPITREGEIGFNLPRNSIELTASLITEERPVQALRFQTDIWSPSLACGLATPPPSNDISMPHTPLLQSFNLSQQQHHHLQDGSSPPEAAIEATPETTPVKDTRQPRFPSGSTVKRALTLTNKIIASSNSKGTSPLPSNPSSPLKKEASPWYEPTEDHRQPAVMQVVQDRQKYNSSGAVEIISNKNGASLSQERGLHEATEKLELPNLKSASVNMVDSVLHDPHGEEECGDYEECQQALGSPCTSGGLHMPNSQSFRNFARRVHRLRNHSVCVPYPALSAGTSPSEGAGFPKHPASGKVRRAVSCPDMKRGWLLSSSNSANSPLLDEKDEDDVHEEPKARAVNGNVLELKVNCKQSTLGTQTTFEQWPAQPYEHLFLAVFPSSQTDALQHDSFFSPYSILDQVLEATVKEHRKDHSDSKKTRLQESEAELKSLKGQLHLLHLQLQFEKHRREAHAERNRRLAGRSRANRALEEHNVALKDQLILLQKEYEKLQSELDSKRRKSAQTDQKHETEVLLWKTKCVEQHKELQAHAIKNQLLENQLGKMAGDKRITTKDLEFANSIIFDLRSEVCLLQESARVSERLSGELAKMQRELMVVGEMQQRQTNRLAQVPLLANQQEENIRFREVSKEEISGLKQQLESRTSSLEAAKARLIELELMNNRKDTSITEQKRLLKFVKDKYSSQLEATEEKYQAVRSVNRRLAEEIVSLQTRLQVCEGRRMAASKPTPIRNANQSSSPLSESLKPSSTVTTSTEMTDLHIIVDHDLPPVLKTTHSSPPPRSKTGASAQQQRDSAMSSQVLMKRYD